MAATLGQLVIQLAVDTARFEGDLGRAEQMARTSAGGIKSAFTDTLDALALSSAAAATALTAVFLVGSERAEDVGKLGQQIGISAEALSRLEFAAKSVGVPVDSVATGIKRLSVLIGDAAGGSASAAAKFANIGISIYDAAGNVKSADVVFAELATKFSGFAEGSNKTADAISLMGKSGNELLPVLNLGADGLQHFADKSDQVGNTINEKAVNAADAFRQKLTELQGAVGGVETSFSTLLTPYVDDLITAFVKLQTSTGLITGAFHTMQAGLNVVGDAYDGIVQRLKNIGSTFDDAWQHYKKLDFTGAAVAFGTGIGKLATDTVKNFGVMEGAWDAGGEKLDYFTVKLKKLKEAPAPTTGPGFDIGKQMDELYTSLNKSTVAMEKSVGNSVDGIKPHFTALGEGAQHVWDQIDQIGLLGAQGLQNDLVTFFTDPAKEGFSGLVVAFAKTIQQMLAQAAAAQLLKALFGSVGSADSGSLGSGGFGNVVAGFFGSIAGGRAGGGPVSAGSTYMVGENGPELFTPGSSGGITPNGMAGSPQFNHTYHIDARGADADRIMQIFPSLMAQTREATKRDILNAFRRSGVPAPRIA